MVRDAERVKIVMNKLNARTRRIVQALLYEAIAIAICTPLIAVLFNHPPGSSLRLTITTAAIALVWNYIFNTLFEKWESHQAVRGRSASRRLIHSICFEGGLAIFLIPLVAWWLDVSFWTAFLTDLAFLSFFFVYTIVFTWAFDRIIGLPASAR